jgi:adenine-specific DNA-methyltransferase
MSPRRSRAASSAEPVKAIQHAQKRVNIPTADGQDFLDEQAAVPASFTSTRDQALDPQLVWQGKDTPDAASLVVEAPPIYIQEKIDPRVIVEGVRLADAGIVDQPTLYEEFDGLGEWESVEYYRHQANWSNRMILGDSLPVMASLAEKEHLRGKIQMIYVDPPYGIKFGSNWQPSTRRRQVSDTKRVDVTREVEQIKAFRDTWQHGVHSYLAYLCDRLTLGWELLTDSGSVFVQIGEDNVHVVRCLLDEIFGSENFVSLITFKKTSGAGSFAGGTNLLAGINDYLLWYAKDAAQVKYRTLFRGKEAGGQGGGQYTWYEDRAGMRKRLNGELPDSVRLLRPDQLTSQTTRIGQTTVFPVEIGGSRYVPGRGGWKTNAAGMQRLAWANRLMSIGRTLTYVRYLDDFPAFPYTNLWDDTVTSGFAEPKIYVVQTNTKVVERCMLMATDPGDLVLDPTCGSGTTAYVAEHWGRRWITIDTSRVALTLARQRLMSAKFPYYLLADSPAGRKKESEITGKPPVTGPTSEDVRKGFVYERVPHVTLKSIANNPDIRESMSRAEIEAAIRRHAPMEILYDRPFENKKKVRVTGPFTVESLSPHRTLSADGDTTGTERAASLEPATVTYEQTIIDHLLKSGVSNGQRTERLEFESLVPYPDQWIHAEGARKDSVDGTPQRIAVSIGPQYAPVGPNWIKSAARAASKGLGFDILVVCAFSFAPETARTAEEFRLGRLSVLLVRMNADLAMGQTLLKNTGSGNLFTLFGEPDVVIEPTEDGLLTVKIRGVDVFDPTTGEVRAKGTEDISVWMVDTAYDEESFFVRHCYFTGGGDPYKKLRRALKAEIDEAAWESLYTTTSRPFAAPSTGKIAVKVINDYGDEVLKVYGVHSNEQRFEAA